MKTCIIDGCDAECVKGRRYCLEHYLERHRKQAKERYIRDGRYSYPRVCCFCGKAFNSWRKTGIFCSKRCYQSYNKQLTKDAANNYERSHTKEYSFMHRRIAEQLLKTKLGRNIVVHHLDWSPMNNASSNLLILSNSDHIKLHSFVLYEMAKRYKQEPLHNPLAMELYRKQLTDEWLKDVKPPYILLSNIGDDYPNILDAINKAACRN